ncbi:MAG: BON domain-containing protein [Burkholderiales bacterium]|nr:BON domain-containing protein [Burkholderiales bacterium]
MRKLSYLLIALLSTGIMGCAATVVGAGAGTAAATGTDTRGFSTVVSDQNLEHKVNSVLSAQVPNGSFTVAGYSGKILLAGQVPNEDDYDKADIAVVNTHGVKKVWNFLTVGKNETVGDISADAYITSAAKTRLIGQKGVNTNNIKVVTCAGVVYLLGQNAGRREQLDAAISGIRQISGVKNVVNLIRS